MLCLRTLIAVLLCASVCFAGPVSEAKNAENEIEAKKEEVKGAENAQSSTKNEFGAENGPTVVASENEPTFGAASAFGEGHFHNEEYGYAGKGAAAAIGGGVVTDKGVAAGGALYAKGLAGVDTVPFKGFVGVSTNQQATFNNFGEKAQPFEHELKDKDELKASPVAAPSPVKTPAAKPAGEKAPTVGLPTVANTIGTLFRPLAPLSPPALFNTLTGGVFQLPADEVLAEDKQKANAPAPAKVNAPAPEKVNTARDEASDAAAAAAAEPEESGFYSFIRPLTPSGIAANVATLFRPLSTVSGQAQGSITLTGGASYTGNPPKEEPQHKPHPEPHHPEHPPHHDDDDHKPGCQTHKPCHVEDDKLHECKALCHKKGKAGGSLHGGCCTCSCPAPEVPPGHLCCSGSDEPCDTHCKRNSFYKYAGGACNAKSHNCECRCNPWEPCWAGEVSPAHGHGHEHSLQTEETEIPQ